MKLKEFLRNYSKYCNCQARFKDYLHYPIEEFVKLNLNNRPYQLLQQECAIFLAKIQGANSVDKNDGIETSKDNLMPKKSDVIADSAIADIPYSLQLLEHIFPNNKNLIQSVIARVGQSMTKLIHMLDIDVNKLISSMPGVGVGKINELCRIQDYIKDSNNWASILDIYDCCIKEHSFPEGDYGVLCEMSISDKIDLAMKQYVEMIGRITTYIPRVKDDYERLHLLFIERKSKKEIASLLKLTEERVRQIKEKYIQKVFAGNIKNAQNLSLSKNLLEEINDLFSQIPIYCSENELGNQFGCSDFENSTIRDLLPIDVAPTDKTTLGEYPYSNFDQCYYIPKKETRANIQTYINTIYQVMSTDEIRPISIDEIMDLLNDKDSRIDFEKSIVIDLLDQHSWFEQVNDNDEQKYQLKYEYLKDYTRIGRIVYLYKNVKINDIDAINEKLARGECKSIRNSETNAKSQLTWCVQGQTGFLEYNETGIARNNLKVEVQDFIRNRELFSFQELIKYLKSKEFDVSKEKSIRSYATDLCHTSINDNNLFCNSEYIEKYNNYDWKAKHQIGITNWIANVVKDVLLKEEGYRMIITDLTKIVKEAGKKENYRIRNVEQYISKFDAFETTEVDRNRYLCLTEIGQNMSAEEWSVIGKQSKPLYFEIIISKVMSLLKEADNCEMLLSDLRKACAPEMGEVCLNSFYKIISNELPEQIQKIVKADGKKYLKLVQEKIEYVPTLTIDETVETIENEESIVVYNQPSQERTYGEIIQMDWDKFAENLRREISYNYWDLSMSIESGIKCFIDFIKSVGNRRISEQIPRRLFVIWNYKSDIYDWNEIVNELTVCFEEVLRQVHKKNTGKMLETFGLADTYKQIPEIKDWYDKSSNVYSSSVYYNSMRKLQYDRNKIAHGCDLDNNSFNLIKKISNYTALYIYMVAKFLQVETNRITE